MWQPQAQGDCALAWSGSISDAAHCTLALVLGNPKGIGIGIGIGMGRSVQMWWLLGLLVYSDGCIGTAVPAAASLGMWWPVMPLRAMPLVSNAYGAATLRPDVEPGFGLLSLGPITSAPFNGNMQNSTLVVDGAPLAVAVTGWGVCEATRASNTSTPGPYVSNAVRLPWEQHAFLQEWQVCGTY
jgi:hypothetical protein